ncbi:MULTISPECIES: hypothetical protein [Streptomyces]|uniref:hypothetical protein n=1 Tax=Streptomyces TaxID=1883 RepID=UPI00345BA922
MKPIRWQCPELHGDLSAPTYGIHSSRPDFICAAVERNACEHITPEERTELCAGRVPTRLVPKEEDE